MSKPRLVLFAGSAVVLGTAVALLVGELALRAFWPQRSAVSVGMFRTDPAAGFSLQPGYENVVRVPEYTTSIHIDTDGYRVPEVPESENQPVRILAVGDSFTFGVGVEAEEAWPEVLEDQILADQVPGVAVRNGGVGGYGPLRTQRLLEARQVAWEPDIIVHAVYLGNDLEDAQPATYLESPRIQDGRMVAEEKGLFKRTRFLLRIHSHLYAFVRDQFYGMYLRTPFAERSRYLDPMGLAEWPAEILEESWPAAAESIRGIRVWAEARDIRYLVVLIPLKYQVNDDAWDEYRRRWDLPDEALDRDHAQRVVTHFLAEQQIPFLDLLPAMQQADPRRAAEFYFPVDAHWTPTGHRFAADRIRRELRERGWVAQLVTPPPVAAAPDLRSG
ncbi:MAG: hypothetical protein HKN12_02195 [Gemmatimonadetes bacterium]|nr:hypothetical protein [Gemmatimonadota bacterium]